MHDPLVPPEPRLDTPVPQRLLFLLGGRDREMVEIGRLVAATLGPDAVRDAGLSWGAQASVYGAAFEEAAATGRVPVLVELTLNVEPPAGAIVVDHHGTRAGDPSALAQVFALLRLPVEAWTREHALVAANDVGHVDGMRAIGATTAEVARLRAEDRAAQGITPEEEAQGRTALARAEHPLPGVLLVRLPHTRTATVTDTLVEADTMPDTLLILTPTGAHAFGSGTSVAALDTALPGGWQGGDLPRRGYWGLSPAPEDAEARALDALATAGPD
ncbi:hypothetical protein [Methylorubrum podarium]|uniref:hypothetical protein n=1 Tax=Methylorubrum podarium TaxID=200476 RepID=UPI001EE34B26|nr:hypothetical protein [Methylorubrum podarium]GJE70935.1 hypothetical protein CHKEEEPN_2477 [Methylorubrum podarium]